MSERPSPFTISEPGMQFAEGPPSEPAKPHISSLGVLIQNLRAFAEFYEQATREIETAQPLMKRSCWGSREAQAHYGRKQFLAIQDIDRIRALTLKLFGEELTIGSAQKLLGTLLQSDDGTISMDAAQKMMLGEVADRLGKPVSKNAESSTNEPPLSERQYDVLDTIFNLKAFSPDSRVTTEEIAQRLELDTAQLKEAVSALVRMQFVESKKGRGGGIWLTDPGKNHVVKQRKR